MRVLRLRDQSVDQYARDLFTEVRNLIDKLVQKYGLRLDSIRSHIEYSRPKYFVKEESSSERAIAVGSLLDELRSRCREILPERIVVEDCSKRSLAYRIGLILADGYVADDAKIIFATTNYTLLAILLKSFGEVYVKGASTACVMVTGEVKPVLSFHVLDRDAVRLMERVIGGEVPFNSAIEFADFLSGLIDGDGTVDGFRSVIRLWCCEEKLRRFLHVLEEGKRRGYFDYVVRVDEVRDGSKLLRVDFSVQSMRESCFLYLLELLHPEKSSALKRVRGTYLSRDSVARVLGHLNIRFVEKVNPFTGGVSRRIELRFTKYRDEAIEFLTQVLGIPRDRVRVRSLGSGRKCVAVSVSRYHVDWCLKILKFLEKFNLRSRLEKLSEGVRLLSEDLT